MNKDTSLAIRRFFFLLAILLTSTSLFSNELENTDKVPLSSVSIVTADITSFSPDSGHAGTVVTITDTGGSFISTDIDKVSLNGSLIPAPNVIYLDAKTLEVIIPCGATSGKFIVDGGAPSADSFTYIEPKITTLLPDLSFCVGETIFNNPPLYNLPLDGEPITLTDGKTLTFDWTNDNSAIGLGTGNTKVTAIPSVTAVNGTSEPITATITVTPRIDGCYGNPQQFTITVNPAPIVEPLTNLIVCDGELVPNIALSAQSPLSTGGGTTYTWSGNNNAAIGQTVLSNTTSPIPSFTATNISNTSIFSKFTVIPTFAGCVGSSEIFTIEVLPASVGGTATAAASTICSGGSTTITLAGGYLGNIQWQTNTSGSYVNITSATRATYITPALTSTTSYRAIVTNGTCGSSTSTVATVTVDPTSVGGTAAATASPICSGDTKTITLTGYEGNIQWQTNASGTYVNIPSATSATYITPALTSTTSYQAIVTSGTCSSANSNIITVTVDPTSVGGTAAATASPICSGDTKTITLTGSIGSIQWQTNASGTYVNIPSATSATYITPALTSTTSYQAIVTSGTCSSANSNIITVTVDPTSVGGTATATASTICSGDTTTITLAGGYIGNIQWQTNASGSYVNIPSAINPSYTTPALTSTTSYQAIVTSGVCSSSTSTVAPVTVNALSLAPTTSPIVYCAGDTASPLTATGTNLLWYTIAISGIGSATAPTPSTVSAGTTNYYVSQTPTNSCESPRALLAVTVNPIPTIIDIPNQNVCIGDVVTFGQSFSSGFDYEWSSNGGYRSILPEATITFTNLGTEVYTYRITDNNNPTACYAEDTFTIIVNPLPQANVIASTPICEGNSIAIGAPAVLGSTYSWSSVPAGFTSTSSNPTISPTVTTTYTLTETNLGCSGTNRVTITVEPDPTSTITTGSSTICETENAVFYEATINNNYNTATWEVVPASAAKIFNRISDTQVEFTPSISGIAAGSAILRHTLTNTCDVIQPATDFTITINRQSIANAGVNLLTCGTTPISLDGTSSQFATTYSWTKPGNVSGSLSPANSATPIYTPSVADVTNYNAFYGTTGIPFTLTTGSGSSCTTDSRIVYITIVPSPIISAGPATTIICENATYTPSEASVDANTASYSWKTNGDGILTNINSLTPTYTPGPNDKSTGTVTLTLEAQGNTPCLPISSTTILSIKKNPVITPISDAIVCASSINPLNISASIQNPGTILWTTSGSGSFNGTDTSATPIYTPNISDFNTAVTFTLTVQPISPCGTAATEIFIYTINAIPTSDAGGDFTICQTEPTYTLMGNPTNASSVEWSTPNGSGSFDNRFINTPLYTFSPADILQGTVSFILTARNSGCTTIDTDQVDITIQKNPQVTGIGGPYEICQGQSQILFGSTTNSSSVLWTKSSGSGTFVGTTTLYPEYTSTSSETGTITFTLTADPIGPCATPASKITQLVIVANPTANAGTSANRCEGDSFTVSSASATNYAGTGGSTGLLWSTSGSGSFTGGNTLTPTYTPGTSDNNNGSVVLTLTASNLNAPCFNDAVDQMTLTINKIPSITTLSTSIDVCTNDGIPVPITGVNAMDYDPGYLTWTSSSTGNSGFLPSNTPSNTTDAITYTPTAGDIATGSVILTLEAARDPANCNLSTTATVTLNFIPDVQVDAGTSPVTICGDTYYTTTSATAINFSNIYWDSKGSGTWVNQTSTLSPSTAEYTPSAADIAAGTVTLTVTATGLAPCFEVITDTIVLDIEALPVITTIGTAAICESSTSYPISGTSITNNYTLVTLSDWSSTGTGTFTSSGVDNKNPIYTPTAADIASGQVILTLTVDPVAPCIAPQSEDIILNFIPEPIVTATPDLNRCETQFQINNVSATPGTYSSIVWTTAGGGSFLGGINNIENPTYIPLGSDISTGTVALTLKVNPMSPCAVPFVKTMTFNIAKLPVITVVNQEPICQDASDVQVLGTTITNTLIYTYTSTTGTTINNPATLNPTVTPSAADILAEQIVLTIEATPTADCGTTPVTKTVTIPIIKNPKVNAGSPQTICEGSNITTTDATANTAAFGNLQWTNGTGDGSFITPSNTKTTTYQPGPTEIANGSFTLTLTGTATAPCATNAVSTVTYTILKKPVVTVNPTAAICESDTYQVQPGQVVITNMSSVDFVVWTATSPGTIVQGGTLDLEPIFTPSLTDINNGYADLIITVTPKGTCAANTVTETIRVNIAPLATIDATQTNYTFCEGLPKSLNAIFTNYDPSDPTSISWTIVKGTGSITGANTETPTYVPDSDSDTVDISVSVKSLSPCATTITENFTITVVKTPIVTFTTTTATVCSSTLTYNLSGNTTQFANSILWTRVNPVGKGMFSNPTDLNPTYTFTAADITTGSVTLSLTATSDATCVLTDYDEIVITIEDAPTVTITNLATDICQGETFNATATATDASTYLWESVGASDGTFTDANDLILAEYTPGTNDILTGSFTIKITATGTASCGPAVKQQTVNMVPLPTVDAGIENRTNCSSTPFPITGVTAANYSSLLWTSESGSPGTFSDTSIENPTYTPSAAEIAAANSSGTPIILRVTAQPLAPCAGAVKDFITLNLSPVQLVDAGLPQSICEDGIVTLAGSATNSSSMYWTTSSSATDTDFSNPTSGTTSYTPSTLDINTGSVTLTLHAVSATNCPEITDTILVTIIKKPTANAGGPVTICEGSSYTLAGSEATAQNYANLLWTVSGGGSITAGATPLTPTFVPSGGLTGDVTLTLTAIANPACGTANDAIATKIITIVPSPFAAVPATKTICEGTTLSILASEVTATNYDHLTWASSNGLGTFSPATSTTSAATVYTPAANQTGTVNLILTAHALNASCSDVTASISLTIEPALIVDAGLGGTICEDETFTVLGASITNGSGVFSWSIVGPATIVAGTSTGLTPEILPNAGASGTVTLTLTANGTSNCPTPMPDDVTITINPLPIVDAGGPITACQGVTSIPITGTGTNGTTYTWTHTGAGSIQTTANPLLVNYIPGAGDFINPSGITVVKVFLEATGTGNCGNVTSAPMEITLYANPTVFAGADASICEGETYALIGATATNYSSITWDDGTANGTFDYTSSNVNPTYILNPADSGIITLTMTAQPNAACLPTASVFKDAMQLTVEKNPTILASTTVIEMCGETFTLPDLLTVNNASSISWVNVTPVSPVSSPANETTETPTLSPTNAEIANGFMLLEVTAYPIGTNCSTNAIETIRVNLTPNATVEAGTPITECETTAPILLDFGASVSPSTTYSWTEDGTGSISLATVNSLQPSYTPGPNETGIITFTLHAANPPPCLGETSATVTLTLTPQPTVYAGAAATVCEGTPYNLVNATATDYTSISWVSSLSSAGILPNNVDFNLPDTKNPTYTPNADDISRGFVYLIVTAQNSCGIVEDYMKLTIAPGVGVSAGSNATICEGTAYTLAGATAVNATSYSWISSENSKGTNNGTYAGGTFNHSNPVNATTYTPSTDDINTGYVYLTLTGSGDSTCAIDTSVMRLDITANPSITITASTVDICVSTPSVILNSTASNYNTIIWSIFRGPGSITSGGSTQTPTFTSGLSSSITTTQTTVARAVLTPKNGCSASVTADITITIQPLPSVVAGDNGVVCYIPGNPIANFTINNSSVTNASSQVWSTSGVGTFTNGTPPTYQSLSNSCPSTEALTLTATGVGACSTSTISDIVTLTINCAAPNLGAISTTVSSPLCAGTASVIYQVATNPSVTTYNWTVPTGATIVAGNNTSTITVNYGANAISGNVSVYATNTCGNGPISTLAITVSPVPAATSIAGDQTVCAGETDVLFTASPIVGATSYSWTLPTGATIVSGLNTNSITVDFDLTATTGTLEVFGRNACGDGVASSLPITVIAPPTLTTTTTTPICSGDTFTHTLTSVSGVLFTWDRSLQSGILNTASGTGNTITETLVNTTNTARTATYTVTLTTPEGCASTEYVSVDVYPAALLTNAPVVTSICSGTSINYTPTSDPTGTITWSRATIPGITEAGSTGNATPITELLTNTTNGIITVDYELTLPTTTNGCANTVTVSVDVKPLPSAAANLAGPTPVCAGSTGNLYIVDPIDNATSYEWTLPTGATIVSGLNTNSITVDFDLTATTGTLKVFGRNACGDGALESLLIEVVATPTLTSSLTPPDVCSNILFTYHPASGTANVSYSWTRAVQVGILNASGLGNGDINETLVNTSTSPVNVNYMYTLTTDIGCANTETVTVTVQPSPTLDYTGGYPATEICSGDTFSFTPDVSVNPVTSGSVTWTRTDVSGISAGLNSGTGAISEILTNTTGSMIPVTYTLTLPPTTPQGCIATETFVVNVYSAPIAVIGGGGNTCLNSADNLVTFTGSNGTAPYTFEYEIDGVPGYTITTSSGNSVQVASSSSTIGLHTYTLVSVTDSSPTACITLVTAAPFVTIDVYAAPILVITNPPTICANDTVDLTDSSITAGSDAGLSFTYWTNATATASYSTPLTANEGAYYVKGTNSNGCSTIKPVVVTAQPIPTVTVNNPTICVGDLATVSATPNPPGLYDYRWTVPSGASAPGNVASFTTDLAGDYTVEITNQALPNCVSLTATGTITVNESEILLDSSSGTPDQTICISNAIAAINFNINSSPVTSPAASMILVGTLPTGVSFDDATGIISGTPTEGGTFPYSIEASTGCAVPFDGELIVNTTFPTVLIENGSPEIEVCEGSEISLTATGADNYEWYSINTLGYYVSLATTNIYTYTPAINQTLYVIGKVVNGCEKTAQINVLLKQAVSATITGKNSFKVCKDGAEPTITFTASNGIAPYIFTYSIGGIIRTVTTIRGNSAVLSIPTDLAGEYDVKLLNVEDSESTYCSPPELLEPTTAAVTVVEAGIEPKLNTPIYQTICEGVKIDDIIFNITGNATSAYVEGLPSGVDRNFAGTTLTISGAPAVTGIFDYKVVTSGLAAGCNATFEGTITVNQNDTITLISAGKDTQEICPNNSIASIVYELGGGATGATVTGLPVGIVWNIVGDIITISGSVNAAAAVYPYTITTQGICASATETGKITITALGTLSLTLGNQNEIVCVNTVLTNPIQYQGSAGQTLQLNGVLPPGVTFTPDPATGSAIINGKPTLSGTYNYSITTDSNCSDTLDGSIVVKKNAFINLISGSINQMSCVSSPIEPLRYAIPLSVTTNNMITPALPTGINYVVVNGELIISGTPIAILSETVYEISVNNGCGLPAKSTFKLTIEATPAIMLEANSGTLTQSVCQNAPIDAIKFKLSGAATGIDESLLPAFIKLEVDTATGIYTLTGAPVYTGIFNFKIKTVGTSACSAELDVSIENNYAAVSIVRTSALGTDNQTICSLSTPIDDIVYDIIGNITDPSLISVTGLPSGITYSTITTVTGVLLTISGQPIASGIYEYGIEYNNCGGAIKKGFINISTPATISAEVSQISCDGNDGEITVTIFGGVPFVDANGTPFYAINWTGGPDGTFRQNQATIKGLAPGDYTFSGTDAIGCPLPTRTFTIKDKDPLSITLLSMTTPSCNNVCANFDFTGGTGIYTSFTLESFNPQSQVWSIISPPYNNYYNICGLNAGRYKLSVTDSGGCVSEPYLFTISSELSISIEALSFDENICGTGSGIVYAKINSLDTNLTFYYNSKIVSSKYLGDNIYELTFNEIETLDGILKVINSQNCSVEKIISTKKVDEEMLDFEFTSFDFEAYGYYSVKENIEFTNLSFIGTLNPIVYSYAVWDFGDNTPSRVFYNPEDLAFNSNGENIETVFHTYTNDGIYDVTLTVFNSSGCSTSITKTVLIGEGASILLPTAFSPNNDGINDLFRPIFRGVSEISMYIYDNWGNLVYEYTTDNARALENDQDWGWNGIEPPNSEPKNDSYRCYILAKTLDKKVIEKNIRFLIIK